MPAGVATPMNEQHQHRERPLERPGGSRQGSWSMFSAHNARAGRADGRRGALVRGGAVLYAAGAFGFAAGPADAASTLTVFGSAVPDTKADRDTQSVELGVRVTSSTSGYITGIRFYKGAGNTGIHTGTLWNGKGQKRASLTFT